MEGATGSGVGPQGPVCVQALGKVSLQAASLGWGANGILEPVQRSLRGRIY